MTIGLAEAKARLSEVIDRVESGETIIITRSDRPVAQLQPLRRLSAEEAVTKIRAIRKRAAKRNAGKPPWPAPGERFRDIAHRGHRR